MKHRYGPTHQGRVHRAAVALGEDADSAVDGAADADGAQPKLRAMMQMVQSVLRYYKFEQTVASRLRELGKVVYVVLLDDLSKWKCVALQSTSTIAHGDPKEG